mmetsp:Transcript_33979/g.133258  ORF Transcript_33979/g.133258 Transcript_33979/m.133258 type:complete len:116 (-) Transcript_33979:996-1343(-)
MWSWDDSGICIRKFFLLSDGITLIKHTLQPLKKMARRRRKILTQAIDSLVHMMLSSAFPRQSSLQPFEVAQVASDFFRMFCRCDENVGAFLLSVLMELKYFGPVSRISSTLPTIW